jgi:ribosomal protein L11 methyltransferase
MLDKYFELTVTADTDLQEILIAELAELNFDGFVQNENNFTAFTEQQIDLDTINNLFLMYKIENNHWKVETLDNKNWNATWEANFEPVVIGNDIYVRALFHPEKSDAKHTITIQPKMSFGTGHHSTTKLVLEQMLQLNFENKTVLDMGCGTAVLAIYAEIAKAKNIIAIDNDIWAYENATENCTINHCKNISVQLGDEQLLKPNHQFDIIISNITKNFNLANLPLYASLLNQNGTILLSGFYETDAIDFIKLATTLNLKLNHQSVDKNWTMLYFIN